MNGWRLRNFASTKVTRVAAQDDVQLEPAGADGVMNRAPDAPERPTIFLPDDATMGPDPDEEDEEMSSSQDSDDGMRYSPSSPMSVQQLAATTSPSRCRNWPEDAQPTLNILEQEEHLSNELAECAAELFQLQA